MSNINRTIVIVLLCKVFLLLLFRYFYAAVLTTNGYKTESILHGNNKRLYVIYLVKKGQVDGCLEITNK